MTFVLVSTFNVMSFPSTFTVIELAPTVVTVPLTVLVCASAGAADISTAHPSIAINRFMTSQPPGDTLAQERAEAFSEERRCSRRSNHASPITHRESLIREFLDPRIRCSRARTGIQDSKIRRLGIPGFEDQ